MGEQNGPRRFELADAAPELNVGNTESCRMEQRPEARPEERAEVREICTGDAADSLQLHVKLPAPWIGALGPGIIVGCLGAELGRREPSDEPVTRCKEIVGGRSVDHLSDESSAEFQQAVVSVRASTTHAP